MWSSLLGGLGPLGRRWSPETFSLVYCQGGSLFILYFPSQDTHLPKNTIKEEWGLLAKTQKQKGGQEKGIGGLRRGNERNEKREIASQLQLLSRCKLELIKIPHASEPASSICTDWTEPYWEAERKTWMENNSVFKSDSHADRHAETDTGTKKEIWLE